MFLVWFAPAPRFCKQAREIVVEKYASDALGSDRFAAGFDLGLKKSRE